jgi:hypothetical protein
MKEEDEINTTLLIQNTNYDIILEQLFPLGPEGIQFYVKVKCKTPFTITKEIIKFLDDKNIDDYIEKAAEINVREALGVGIPKDIILKVLNKAFDLSKTKLSKDKEKIYRQIKKELNL